MHATVRFRAVAVAILGGAVTITGCTTAGETRPSSQHSASTPPSVASPAPTPTPSPSADEGSYQAGTCLDIKTSIREVACDRPHNYEVMLSKRLEEKPSSRLMNRTCRSTQHTYLSSADATASRLEPAGLGPEKGDDGKWWFTCMVKERDPKGDPVRRTGTLAGALANGLGAFQRCVVGEPLDDGPQRVVTCDQPHRSEAVGVMPVDEFPAGRGELEKVAFRAYYYCEKKVASYLGGTRRGVRATGIAPLREDWLDGDTVAVCYVVSKTPVRGVMRSTGRP